MSICFLKFSSSIPSFNVYVSHCSSYDYHGVLQFAYVPTLTWHSFLMLKRVFWKFLLHFFGFILSLSYSIDWPYRFIFILPFCYYPCTFSMMVQLTCGPLWWHLCTNTLWYLIGSPSCHCNHIPLRYYAIRSMWCLFCILTRPKYLGLDIYYALSYFIYL